MRTGERRWKAGHRHSALACRRRSTCRRAWRGAPRCIPPAWSTLPT